MSDTVTLPPYRSLSAMRKALEEEYPRAGKSVLKATNELEQLRNAYFKAKDNYRRAQLELAGIEAKIKRHIGPFAGVETLVGTFLWTNESQSRGRIQWMQLVADLGLSEETLNKYRGGGRRRSFFFTKRRRMREMPEVGQVGLLEALEDDDAQTP